jgi:hypothetical protein
MEVFVRTPVAAVFLVLLATSCALACSPPVSAPLPVAPTGERIQTYSPADTAFVAEIRGSFREPWRVGVFVKVTDSISGDFPEDELIEVEFMGGDYICADEEWHSAQEVKVEDFKTGSRVLVTLRRAGRPLRVHAEELGARFRVLTQQEG